MIKKKTIGNNPLAAYIGSTQSHQIQHHKEEKKIEQNKTQRVTIHIDVDLINAVKDAVYWEPGLTLTSFTHEAFSKALALLEKKRGEKYPKRKEHNLRGGRPVE